MLPAVWRVKGAPRVRAFRARHGGSRAQPAYGTVDSDSELSKACNLSRNPHDHEQRAPIHDSGATTSHERQNSACILRCHVVPHSGHAAAVTRCVRTLVRRGSTLVHLAWQAFRAWRRTAKGTCASAGRGRALQTLPHHWLTPPNTVIGSSPYPPCRRLAGPSHGRLGSTRR